MFRTVFLILLSLFAVFGSGCGAPSVNPAKDLAQGSTDVDDEAISVPESGPRRVPRPYSADILAEPIDTIEGHWFAETAIMAGTAFPEDVTKGIELEIDDAKYDVSVGGNSDQGTIDADTSCVPNRLTIKGTTGTNAGKTILAVFDFPELGKMRVCYDITGADFPSEFESTEANGYFFVIYKRVP